MSKKLPFACALLLCAFALPYLHLHADNSKVVQDVRKIVLRKKHGQEVPVKLVPGAPAPIDAWLIGETLSMTFLSDFGEAEVTVSADMSAWSVTKTFDTADGTLLLTVDTEPDEYTITVTTSDASYIGGYSVE